MIPPSVSQAVPPALVVLGTVLAAANWYLQPQRSTAWAASLLLLGGLAVALLVARRLTSNPARRGAADSIRSGVVFAGSIMAISLGAKLATTLGGGQGADLSTRASMVVIGAFFMFTGNALPKTLTPLAALKCDPARVQAFQRLSGWIWVITGLGYAVAWLALPLDLAKPVSLALLMSGMLVIVGQIVRLRWL